MNWTVRNNFRHVRRRFTEEKSEKSDSARARTSPSEGAGWLKPFPPSKTSKFESFVMNKKSTGGGGGMRGGASTFLTRPDSRVMKPAALRSRCSSSFSFVQPFNLAAGGATSIHRDTCVFFFLN